MGRRGHSTRKRPFSEYFDDDNGDDHTMSSNGFGLGETLAQLRAPAEPVESSPASPLKGKPDENGNDWQLVEGSKTKKQKGKEKKLRTTYPAFNLAERRQQSTVKIGDLQALALYCIADGVAPNWLAVKDHQRILKAVVLMVPGLEEGMVTSEVPLSIKQNAINNATANGDLTKEKMEISSSTSINQKEVRSRDRRNDSDYSKWKNGLPLTESELNNSRNPKSLSTPDLPEPLLPLADIFSHVWPVKAPGDSRFPKVYSPVQAILTVPLTKSREQKEMKGVKPPRGAETWLAKRTPIMTFIHSAEELLENEYTLHPVCLTSDAHKHTERKQGWVDTRVQTLQEGQVPEIDIQEGSICAGREVLALDCEMCLTEGGVSELTRISVLGWDGEVVVDELVKPEKKIIDYLTPYSGITKQMLDPVTTSLSDIQQRLLKLFHPRTILIGHSLNADLDALKLTHPFIVDTAIIYPHMRGAPLKNSLKFLSQKYLSREIQKGHGTRGHSSIEDAKAVLDLVKQKCEKGEGWGTSDASGESIFLRIARASKSGAGSKAGKIGAVVDRGNVLGPSGVVNIHCETDEEIVAGVKRAANGDADGEVVPGDGVKFTWARLRDLEAFRGWWNGNRDQTYIDFSSCSDQAEPKPEELADAVTKTVSKIADIYAALPPCTAFIVYSGTGDPREFGRLQGRKRHFQKEYNTEKKKWDELTVKWMDPDEEALKEACATARDGCAFLVVK